MKEFSDYVDKYNINVLRASVISKSDKYYSRFSLEDKQNFIINFNSIKKEFFKKTTTGQIKKDTFIYNFFTDIYGSFAYHRMIAEKLPKIRPYTSTCVPGEKIYVESNGNFIVCEKVNNQKKLGMYQRVLIIKLFQKC